MMHFIRTASVLGGMAVVFGAFGAHYLKSALTPEMLQAFETGVRYQFYHALAIAICGLVFQNNPSGSVRLAARLFLAGIICFSGSIYLLSTRSLTGLEFLAWLGPVTPLGGLLFIAGWISLAVAGFYGSKRTT